MALDADVYPTWMLLQLRNVSASSLIENTTAMFDDFERDYENATSVAGNVTSDTTGFYMPLYWFQFLERPGSTQHTSVGVWIRLVALPPVLLLGMTGNCLTLAVMMRENMRRHSYSCYLACLAVTDTIALTARAIFWVNLLQEFRGLPLLINIRSWSACVAAEYLLTANHIMCSWLVVCVTLERAVVILFPFTASTLAKPAVARKVVAGVVVAPFVLLSYVPKMALYLPSSGGCVMFSQPDMVIHYVIATTFVVMLPLALIFLGNTCIVVQLRRRKITAASSNRERRKRHATIMLLSVSVTFFVLCLPNAILSLLPTLRPDWEGLRTIIDPFAMLWDFNFAVNFYLYVIAGIQVREELRAMLCRGSVSATPAAASKQQDSAPPLTSKNLKAISSSTTSKPSFKKARLHFQRMI